MSPRLELRLGPPDTILAVASQAPLRDTTRPIPPCRPGKAVRRRKRRPRRVRTGDAVVGPTPQMEAMEVGVGTGPMAVTVAPKKVPSPAAQGETILMGNVRGLPRPPFT